MGKLIAVSLILSGTVFIYADDIAKLLHLLRLSNVMHHVNSVVMRLKASRTVTLKQKLSQLGAVQKENFILKSYNTMSAILNETGSGGMLKVMKLISGCCAVVGISLALYLNSIMLLPILGIGFALLPMWLTKFRAYRYRVLLMNELSVVLSMVTNSYIRCENIVMAVRENLEYMNEPVKAHFNWFVNISTSVDPDIAGNLLSLKQKIDNPVFRLWCDCMVMCQKDTNQKYSLNAIVEQFSTDKELLNLLSAEVTKPIKLYGVLAAITLLAFPMSQAIATTFATAASNTNVLFTTFAGQTIVVGYTVTLLFGVNRAIDLSTRI